jgi:hypothetical protein
MIPFILLSVSVVAGTIGVTEGAKGIGKILDANEIVEENKKLYKKKFEETEKSINRFNRELENIGKLKRKFIIIRKKAKNLLKNLTEELELESESVTLDNKKVNLDSFISTLEEKIQYTDEFLKGLIKIAGSSYLTYVGALGIATSIGTASTGTAIASLSGAAAENAILAWFGGGSIAAGGGGAALGSAVLSGIVAGPAVFFAGITLSEAGEKALTQAKEFESKVKEEIGKMRILKKEIFYSIKYLKLYQKIGKVILKKIHFTNKKLEKLFSPHLKPNKKKDLIKNIQILVILIYWLNKLLEIDLLEKGSFKLTQQARKILDTLNKDIYE